MIDWNQVKDCILKTFGLMPMTDSIPYVAKSTPEPQSQEQQEPQSEEQPQTPQQDGGDISITFNPTPPTSLMWSGSNSEGGGAGGEVMLSGGSPPSGSYLTFGNAMGYYTESLPSPLKKPSEIKNIDEVSRYIARMLKIPEWKKDVIKAAIENHLQVRLMVNVVEFVDIPDPSEDSSSKDVNRFTNLLSEDKYNEEDRHTE